MNEILSHSWFLLMTALSVVVGFVLAARGARRRYAQEQVAAINSGWLVVLLAAAPMLLHLAVTNSGAEMMAIASSVEIAVTATLIAFIGVMELCGAFAINHSMQIKPHRVQSIAAYTLLLFGAGLITSVEQFDSGSGSWLAALWNLCLLVWGVTAYFATGGLVRVAASARANG